MIKGRRTRKRKSLGKASGNMWMNGVKVFLFGFGGVFLGILVLIVGIKIMSAVIKELEAKKDERQQGK